MEIEWKISQQTDVGHFLRTCSNHSQWSEEENNILREMYEKEEAEVILKALPDHSWRAINARAAKLKIKRAFDRRKSGSILRITDRRFSREDIEYAKENCLDSNNKDIQWSFHRTH